MKINPVTLVCTVQSLTDYVGRRTIKISRNLRDNEIAPVAGKFRTSPFRVKVAISPEAAFSFEPAIQFRSRR
jgi:hypothetical protein